MRLFGYFEMHETDTWEKLGLWYQKEKVFCEFIGR